MNKGQGNATEKIAQFAAHQPLRIRYAQGELIAQQGTYAAGIALVTSGVVVETYVAEGSHEAMGIAGIGDLLSAEALLEHPHVLHQTTIRALTDVDLAFLERGALRRALSEDAGLRDLVLSGISEQTLSMKRSLARLHAPLEARAAWLLRDLAIKAGSCGAGDRIRLPEQIDRRVVAELLGVPSRRLSQMWKELHPAPAPDDSVDLDLSEILAAADQSVSSTIER